MPTLRATELLKQRYTELPLKRDLRKLLGKLPKDKKWNMLLHGIAGSGKSTYSLIFATELASHGSILYGNFEEAQGPTLQNKINTIKQKYGDFNLKKIHFLEPNTEEELWTQLKDGNFKFVIIDSISHIANTEAKVGKFWENSLKFPNVSFIFISHARKHKDGKRESDYKGSSVIGHLVDINQRVVDGIVWNDKNRFLGHDCNTAKGYNIFNKRIVSRT